MSHKNTVARSAALQSINANQPAERAESLLWLNISVRVGEEVLNLPLGVSLEAMEARFEKMPKAEPGTRTARIQTLQKKLLAKLHAAFDNMDGGERRVFNNLIVEGYKVPAEKAEHDELDTSEEEAIIDNMEL